MALDGLLLHQVQKELQSFLPAKLTKLQQISDTELLFTIRTPKGTRRLMISLHSVYNRINLTQESYTTMETPGNFLMLLRKQIDGGILRSLNQIGLDRILHMVVEARDELGDIHDRHLYIELMGKYANMILVDEQGRILDALKRIPPFENNRRTIHPGALYQLPAPHTGKQDPYHYDHIDPNESFTKQFHGFSPLLSKEVQYRMAQGERFDDILEQIQTSDALYLSDVQDKTQFHCIPLTHLEVEARQYPLQQTLEEAMDCDKYREYGDLLFAYMGSIERSETVTLPSFETGEDIRIPLDMRFDIKGNANRYYQKYHKSKRAQSILQEQLTLCEKEIRYFESMEVQLEQATVQDAMEIREELARQGYVKAVKTCIRKKKKQELPHYETFAFDDVQIYVGKNNLQNDHVTWRLGRKSDTWLHAKDLHGAHVVITCEQPDEELLRNAAMLAAWYSNGRYSSSVPVNYCTIRQLKKIPGNKGSFVSLSNYKTIYIDPEPAQIQRLIDEHLITQKKH